MEITTENINDYIEIFKTKRLKAEHKNRQDLSAMFLAAIITGNDKPYNEQHINKAIKYADELLNKLEK